MSLIDHLHEGVVIHNSDTDIVYANSAASKILGLPHDVLMGKNVYDKSWYFTDERANPLPYESYPVARLFATNTNIVHQIFGVQAQDRVVRWVDVNATIITDNQGKRNALVVFSDVTERKNAYEEAALFKRIVDTVDTGVSIADPYQNDMPLIYVNPSFLAMTGYSYDEVIGKNCRYLQGDNREQKGRYEIAEAINSGKSCNVELENYTKEGKLFYNLLTLSPLKDGETIKYYIGVQHDITEIKEQESFIQSIIDANDEMVMVYKDHRINFANQSVLEFFNATSMEEFLQMHNCICEKFISDPDTFSPVNKNTFWIDELLKLEENKQIIALEKEGTIHYMKIIIRNIGISLKKVTLRDVTEILKHEKLLKSKAYHDALTGLYNRQYFYDFTLNQNKQKSKNTGVIIADLDYFKKVNDTYGHDRGDAVLKQTASIFQGSIRSNDTLVRWGGEEFLFVIEHITTKGLHMIGENICRAISNNHFEEIGSLTVSLGGAVSDENESLQSLILRADRALYEAKKSGRNRFELDSSK